MCQYVGVNVSAEPCCVLGAPISEADAERIASMLKVLADPVRLRLVSLIAAAPLGELCACDLPAALGKSQPTVSHHLSQLHAVGLITREQRGKWAWFTLQRDVLATVRQMLGEVG
jgi:ArsR family transcriptional regulator, arsenate/arsenite/antimonite-responsive transcriptional repressor